MEILVYMYYGNSSVSTTSNGANAFDLFFDFTTSIPSGWTTPTVSSYNGYTFSDGNLILYTGTRGKSKVWASGNSTTYNTNITLNNKIVETRYRSYAAGTLRAAYTYRQLVVGLRVAGSPNWYAGRHKLYNYWLTFTNTSSVSRWAATSWSGALTGYNILGFAFDENYRRLYENYTLKGSYNYGSPQPSSKIALESSIGDANANGAVEGYYDWVRVRKFSSVEPILNFEDEESEGPGTVAYCSANLLNVSSATSLLSPLDIDSNASCWYCDKYLEGESVTSGKSGNLEFNFTYTDSDSEAKITSYDFAISQGSDPLSPLFSDSIDLSINPLSPNTTITYSNASVKRNGENASLKQIAYNKTYNWWVKVHNDKGTSSDWVQASSTCVTPSRAFPLVRVVPQKSSLSLDESTLMCSTTDNVNRGEDESGCFDVCWTGEGDTAILDPNDLDNGWNCSICYDTGQNPVLCSSGNSNTFTWSLVNGSADLTNTTNNNVTVTATNTGEEIRTRLLITGSDGCAGEQGEGEGSYPSLPLPTWKEVGN